jgi:hypothetical protein
MHKPELNHCHRHAACGQHDLAVSGICRARSRKNPQLVTPSTPWADNRCMKRLIIPLAEEAEPLFSDCDSINFSRGRHPVGLTLHC